MRVFSQKGKIIQETRKKIQKRDPISLRFLHNMRHKKSRCRLHAQKNADVNVFTSIHKWSNEIICKMYIDYVLSNFRLCIVYRKVYLLRLFFNNNFNMEFAKGILLIFQSYINPFIRRNIYKIFENVLQILTD